jgi:membrane-associated phospholipid phosphatase
MLAAKSSDRSRPAIRRGGSSGCAEAWWLANSCWVAAAVVYAIAFAVPVGRRFDESLFQNLTSSSGDSLRGISSRALQTTSLASLVLLMVSVVLLGISRGRSRRATITGLAILGSIATSQALKAGLSPLDHRLAPGRSAGLEAAYPSGHATAAMALALGFVIVAPQAARALVAMVGGLCAAAVGSALVVSGSHYASDVVGGFLVAAAFAWIAATGIRCRGERAHAEQARTHLYAGLGVRLGLFALLTLSLATALRHSAGFITSVPAHAHLVSTVAVFTSTAVVLSFVTAFLAAEERNGA